MPYYKKAAKITGLFSLIFGPTLVVLGILGYNHNPDITAVLVSIALPFLVMGPMDLIIVYVIAPREEREIEEEAIILKYELDLLRSARNKEADQETSQRNQLKRDRVRYSQDEIVGKCSVCELSIYLSDDTLMCPVCDESAHRDHLLEWIKVKGNCPNCGTNLR